jgi:hypothetical protein
MGNSDSRLSECDALQALIGQAENQSRELRQTVDRIVELSPEDRAIQDLDQFVDVLLVKLSAAQMRSAKTPHQRRDIGRL